MNYCRVLAFAACLLASSAVAQFTVNGRNCGTACYVAADPNVPVFSASNLVGATYPSAQTPTNFSMVAGSTIAQPAQQTGPAAATQSGTGHVTVSTKTLTLDSALSNALPNSTQILANNLGGCGASPTSAAPANCPVTLGLLSGDGKAIGSTYSLSGLTTQTMPNSTAFSTIPLGLNEDAIVSWDSVIHRQWDSGTALACVLANAISGIDHVSFYLDGGTTPVTATNTTVNSETGAPDYCVAAPTSLFSGHNGVHMIRAVVYPVVGWPVVLTSNQLVTVGPSTSTITVRGMTPANTVAGPVGSLYGRFYQITNSSDTATFPNASTNNGNPGITNLHGIYCVAPLDADRFGLVQGTWAARTGAKPLQTPACNIQLTGGGTNGTNTLTMTAGPSFQGAGQPIVGQTITGAGLSGTSTVSSVTGTSPNYTIGYTGTALSADQSGQTYTFVGNIPSTASGATFTLTPLHAGGTAEKGANQNNGSFFFFVNASANGATALEVNAYASLTGSNANPASAASPAATLQGAMLAITPTNGGNKYYTACCTNVQTLATAGSCTTFTLAGNTSGAVPFQVGMPVKYDGQTVSNGIFVMDGSYFIQSAAANAVTLAATPGGPCINDTALVAAGGGVASSASILYDYSETSLLAQHTGGGVNYFSLGDLGAYGPPVASSTTTGGIERFSRLAYTPIGPDPVTATFENVVVNSVGLSSTNGNNVNMNGLGIDSIRSTIRNVYPTATVHLTRGIPEGASAANITFLTSELPSTFPLILQGQTNQGTHPTQVVPNGGGCLPTSGSGGTDNANAPIGLADTVMVTAPVTVDGPMTTLTLVGGVRSGTGALTPNPSAFVTLDECPLGLPVDLSSYWAYEGVNIWFDNTTMVAPTPFMASVTTAGATQLSVNVATNSSVFNLAQGLTGSGYIANSLIFGGAAAGTKSGSNAISNLLIDRSGTEAWTDVNVVNGFRAYGIEEPVVIDTASANVSIDAAGLLTVNSVSSGQLKAGMGVIGSCSPAVPLNLFLMGPSGTKWITSRVSMSAITNCNVTLTRSIWYLSSPGNTARGNYIGLPLTGTNPQAVWSCSGGVSRTYQTEITSYDYKTSAVIVADAPSAACPLDGNSLIGIIATFHEDMLTWITASSGFQAGINVSGLRIVNSEGYGWATLAPNPNPAQNFYEGNSYSHIFLSQAGTQSTYADVAMGPTNRNMLFRTNDFGGVNASSLANLNGTYVWDGVNCGVTPNYFTNLGATTTGVVVRNVGWPGQGSSPAGSC